MAESSDNTPLLWTPPTRGTEPQTRELTLKEVLATHDLVSVDESGEFIIVSERSAGHQYRENQDFTELGSTGITMWGALVREEYNSELRGQNGTRVFDKMRRSDATVRASLRLVKTPVLAGRWYVEPANDSKKAQKAAKHVENNLFKQMTVSWPQILVEALLMLDFGWYAFEKVYTRKNGLIWWQKFAPRHPMDCQQWYYDQHGGPDYAEFYRDNGSDPVSIPIEKMLVFTFDKEAGNMEGISALRSAYKHWYIKDNLYKIDAIQKERHGVGIPVITLPLNFTQSDKLLADQMGRNLRSNEKAHVVLPPGWGLSFAKIEGQPTDPITSIEHHDKQIIRNVLAEFMIDTNADSVEKVQMFLKATRYIADIVRDVFNKWAIPELVEYNFGNADDNAPELRVRRIGEQVDWRTLSFALRNLVGAGLVVPDGRLEKWLRDEMDLPAVEMDTLRAVVPAAVEEAGAVIDQQQAAADAAAAAAAGNGGFNQGAGLPRQSAKPQPSAGSNGRSGRDGSGG